MALWLSEGIKQILATLIRVILKSFETGAFCFALADKIYGLFLLM